MTEGLVTQDQLEQALDSLAADEYDPSGQTVTIPERMWQDLLVLRSAALRQSGRSGVEGPECHRAGQVVEVILDCIAIARPMPATIQCDDTTARTNEAFELAGWIDSKLGDGQCWVDPGEQVIAFVRGDSTGCLVQGRMIKEGEVLPRREDGAE